MFASFCCMCQAGWGKTNRGWSIPALINSKSQVRISLDKPLSMAEENHWEDKLIFNSEKMTQLQNSVLDWLVAWWERHMVVLHTMWHDSCCMKTAAGLGLLLFHRHRWPKLWHTECTTGIAKRARGEVVAHTLHRGRTHLGGCCGVLIAYCWNLTA